MTANGFLKSPRVRVLWGDVNLTSYPGGSGIEKGTPLVYDVQVDLNAENEAPTASMKWDPTGPGFAVYESFINSKEKLRTQITVEFFYSGGKRVVFVFVWAGQSVNYGNDMSVTIKMVSELAGLVNGNIRSTAQAYDEKTGASPQTFIEKYKKQFAIENRPDIVQYDAATLEYWKKVKLLNQYGNDWTFGNAVSELIKQTGDQAFPINISQSSIVVMAPFSWPSGKGSGEVIEASATSPEVIKPNLRYGYFLGPSVIDTMTRESMWQAPQKDNNNTPGSQRFATQPQKSTTTQQTPPTTPQKSLSQTDAKTSSPVGTSGGRASLSVASKENPNGPERQVALNQEKLAKLNFSTLMSPVLVGIKPHDIVYIPSLTGNYIEDWIVQSVGYSQQNGRVDISVQATRVLGLGTPMNVEQGKKFQDRAKSLKLIGPGATLDAWDSYAWGATLTGTLQTAATNLSGTGALSTEKLTPGGIF